MKLTTPLTALRNATSDMWRMHDFNYQLPKKEFKEYWDKVINFEYLADLGLISDEHLNLFKYADSALEAWKIIKSSQTN